MEDKTGLSALVLLKSVEILVVVSIALFVFMALGARVGDHSDTLVTVLSLYCLSVPFVLAGVIIWIMKDNRHDLFLLDMGNRLARTRLGSSGSQSYVRIKKLEHQKTKKKRASCDVIDPSEVVYQIEGRGNQVSDGIDLEAGMYRARYHFSNRVSFHAQLIHRLSGAVITILNRREGSGSTHFKIDASDRYVLEVSCRVSQPAYWWIEIERL